MSIAQVLGILAFVGPVLVLFAVLGVLWCIGNLASGQGVKWPWKK
jgi:hypothetical protein